MIAVRHPRPLVVLLLLSNVVALGACARSKGPAVDPDADRAISAEIMRLIGDDERLSGEDIRVETSDGVVILSGVVASTEEVRRTIRLASRVSGVRQVVNRLRIVQSTGPPDPTRVRRGSD